MGCGTGGANHLMVGTWGHKGNKPLCGDSFGYMWDRETFDRRVEEGNACIACLRTLERDEALAECERLRKHIIG